MERKTTLEEAKALFGPNLIGPEELSLHVARLGIKIPDVIPEIPYDAATLAAKAGSCLLVLSVSKMKDGSSLTLLSLLDNFGNDPKRSEPCFYNQDWYLNEKFAVKQLECKWNLISASLFNESRGKSPDVLLKNCAFPPAVLCAYVFFVAWFHLNKTLWPHDFIWCDDVDHNGDRVYVGKYHDINGINKNGFSIHRHLALRNCYGCVDFN
jgi:hypothetical protein